MDANSDANFYSGESSPSSGFRLAVHNSPLLFPSATCALCHRILLSDDNETGDLEALIVCGDCKFLLLEDMETTSPDMHGMRMSASRRRRYSSSESIDSMFSQQFSQMAITARQNQSHDNQSVDGEGAASTRSMLQSSSRTSPSGSRRFRRLFSDYDSDGFDSLYGETESNVSFRRSRTFRGGEPDTISYSLYDGESDASIDGRSILENEHFGHPNGGSDLETDSDTDIDPMNAGLYPWNSENEEEEYVGEDSDWEETHIERDPLESVRSVAQFHGLSRLNTGNVHIYSRRQSVSPEVEGALSFRRAHERMIQAHGDDLPAGFRELVTRNHFGDSVDYLDARGFENLIQHLAETEDSRRGPPPASVSFVNDLPCLTVNEDDKLDGVTCAICKDPFSVGTVVKQLPCCHIYHPSCIYPWLSARNTCPLCRYELPTDDCDYEARNRSREYRMLDTHRHDGDDAAAYDGPSQLSHTASDGESAASGSRDIPRNGWFFAAAAPIVGILGMSLMLWFRTNGGCQRSHSAHRRDFPQRRWWWLYF